ncbi:MAG: hypothetical protein J1E42_03190 [Akkermansiaceae bacterium]|nr:hypothetical protein [Akkermansiaceae bacterium]
MNEPENIRALNAYEEVIREYGITVEKFYEVGIKMCLFAPHEEAMRDWLELKKQFLSHDKPSMKLRMVVHEDWLRKFYEELFELELVKDRDGNLTPNETLCNLLGICKPANYVCAHIFGGTNNPLLFNSLFNVCYIPAIYAPLTNDNRYKMTPLHAGFRNLFLAEVQERFGDIIADYNSFLLQQRIMERIEFDLKNPESYPKRFIANIKEQWLPLQPLPSAG